MIGYVKTASALLVFVVSLYAQLNLNAISSMCVRDWSSVGTIVDSVDVSSVVSNGLVRTEMTMVLTPDGSSGKLDSIEISAWMQLPTDFVMSDMYLWVGGKPVRAAIQDRALASAQYEEIVNRRKDPCLVEFSGDGYYSLKIFPAKTGESRKVKLVFNHTIDDDSINLATACIPLVFDTAAYYYSYNYNSVRPQLKYMKVSMKSLDGKTYAFEMPGLGSGEFSSKELILEKEKIVSLAAGTISIVDPSGSGEYFWGGTDKDNSRTIGFSMMLAESTVVLEPEPQTRIIVLDVREQLWNPDKYYNAFYEYYYNGAYKYEPYYNNQTVDVWHRAQKMAIACLQNYVNSSQKFNVVIAGSSITQVFDSPVAGTIDNLLEAGKVIASANPDKLAATDMALEKAIDQAGKGVVILITDLIRPANYSAQIFDANGNFKEERISDDGRKFDTLVSELSSKVIASGINLFTIDDEWALWDMAHLSGGFRLGTLRDVYYYTYAVEPYYIGNTEKFRPSLPKLFIDNPYNYGISGVKVESKDAVDVVHTVDNNGIGYWYMYDVMPMEGAIRKSRAPSLSKLRRMALPQYSSSSGLLRVSALSENIKTLSFDVSGKLGGLAFTAKVTGSPEAESSIDSSVQMAFRKSEMLAQSDWYGNADSIKAIGKSYHIVTRQTSLLALEPGMELWADTLSPQNAKSGDGSNNAEDLAAPADERGAYSENGMSLDSLSLDDMINGLTAVRGISQKPQVKSFSAYMSRDILKISIPAEYRSQAVELKLFDLKGRLIVSKRLAPADMAFGEIMWNTGSLQSRACGKYVLKILAAGTEKSIGLPVLK